MSSSTQTNDIKMHKDCVPWWTGEYWICLDCETFMVTDKDILAKAHYNVARKDQEER